MPTINAATIAASLILFFVSWFIILRFLMRLCIHRYYTFFLLLVVDPLALLVLALRIRSNLFEALRKALAKTPRLDLLALNPLRYTHKYICGSLLP